MKFKLKQTLLYHYRKTDCTVLFLSKDSVVNANSFLALVFYSNPLGIIFRNINLATQNYARATV